MLALKGINTAIHIHFNPTQHEADGSLGIAARFNAHRVQGALSMCQEEILSIPCVFELYRYSYRRKAPNEIVRDL